MSDAGAALSARPLVELADERPPARPGPSSAPPVRDRSEAVLDPSHPLRDGADGVFDPIRPVGHVNDGVRKGVGWPAEGGGSRNLRKCWGGGGGRIASFTPSDLPRGVSDRVIYPIRHPPVLLGWKELVIGVDLVGGAARFAGLPRAGLVLITHPHSDHLAAETLQTIAPDQAPIIAPPTVAVQLPAALRARTTVFTNGQSATLLGVTVEAIPAYDLTTERLKFHPRGRDNGYLLTLSGRRVYLSSDTEDTSEMRALRNIDVAFLCMNLPYTMTVDQAASAVRAFRPKIVHPYHYRGADLEKFKQFVADDAGAEVRLRNWYQ